MVRTRQKYYYQEHLAGYGQMQARGLKSWGEVHGDPDDFGQFSSRGFLEAVLPRLAVKPGARVLELGCGTGPGACFLAWRGFRVEGIDLIPAAIDKARDLAGEMGLDIGYKVMDVCDLPAEGPAYDLIVDSYCSQGIVAAADRVRMLGAIKGRLAATGYLLMSCCVYEPERIKADENVVDEATGKRYLRFDDEDLWDVEAEVCYGLFRPDPLRPGDRAEDYDGTVQVNGQWYIHRRCYRRPESLRAELEGYGFAVLEQSGEIMENAVCVHAGSGVTLG